MSFRSDKSALVAWLAVAGYMAAIFWLSHQTIPLAVPIEGRSLDFIAHAAEFGMLSALVWRACQRTPSPWWRGHAIHLAIFLVATYGLADEMHQAMIPGRACEFIDWVADITGAIVVQMVWLASD